MKFLKFNNLSRFSKIEHFITYRKGGCYNSPFSCFNLSLSTGGSEVITNRNILAKELKTELNNFVFQNQTASNNISIITSKNKGAGTIDYSTSIKNNDSLITNEQDIYITVLAADCVPILMYDAKKNIVAATHAGWQGTVKKIAQHTVLAMQSNFNSDVENIYVGIGPAIGKCCYEIGNDVAEIVKNNFSYYNKILSDKKNDKYYLDLQTANLLQLTEIGIPKKKIEITKICTFCENNLFFSARKKDLGRFASGIKLQKITNYE